MSFYRLFVSAIAAVAITAPAFADDTTAIGPTTDPAQTAQPANSSDAQAANGQGTTPQQAQVNLNKASVSDLMKVNGVNASKARAIVAWRKKHGSFKSIDDVAKVKGFNHMKADDLKAITNQFTV